MNSARYIIPVLRLLSLPTDKSRGFRSPVSSPRLSGCPYIILGLTQHSSASSAYYPGRRRTAPTHLGLFLRRKTLAASSYAQARLQK